MQTKTINVTQYQLAAILLISSQGKTRYFRFCFWIFSQKTEIEILSSSFTICNLIQVPYCLFIHLFIYLFIPSFIYLLIPSFIYLFMYIFIRLSVHRYMSHSTFLSLYCPCLSFLSTIPPQRDTEYSLFLLSTFHRGIQNTPFYPHSTEGYIRLPFIHIP